MNKYNPITVIRLAARTINDTFPYTSIALQVAATELESKQQCEDKDRSALAAHWTYYG
jgi:hypothetical protein